MSELKTKPTSKPVAAFIESVDLQWKQEDSQALIYLMENHKRKTVMWETLLSGLKIITTDTSPAEKATGFFRAFPQENKT